MCPPNSIAVCERQCRQAAHAPHIAGMCMTIPLSSTDKAHARPGCTGSVLTGRTYTRFGWCWACPHPSSVAQLAEHMPGPQMLGTDHDSPHQALDRCRWVPQCTGHEPCSSRLPGHAMLLLAQGTALCTSLHSHSSLDITLFKTPWL